MSSSSVSHPELRDLRNHLQSIYNSVSHFQPPAKRPPVLDSSLEVSQNSAEDTHWLQHNNIPGLKKLKESVKIDLDALDKFLEDADSDNLPPLSTNAPYLIGVWNEVLCAQAPVICVFKSFSATADETALDETRKQSSTAGSRLQSTKVDVVADCGKQWIRLNTIKNSRILAEFREIDSYLTDDESSDEEDQDYRPSLAQKEFDNSILRMGRSLVATAKVNPLQLPILDSEQVTPRIIMRLTRLDPDAEPNEPRIAQTVQALVDMGVEVQLGERTSDEIPEVKPNTAPHPSSLVFEPTTRINLDLSVLIALVSDLTHSPLPKTIEEAKSRFIPPERYLEWKKKINATKTKAKKLVDPDFDEEKFEISLPAQQDMAQTTRALTNQVLQEMGKGLLQEMADKLNAIEPDVPRDKGKGKIEFWTTREARDRCLRIVSKVGGPKEKQRVQALLFDSFASDSEGSASTDELDLDADYLPAPNTLDKAEEAYWDDSRYPHKFLPLIPLHFYPVSSSPSPSSAVVTPDPYQSSLANGTMATLTPAQDIPPFFRSLHSTCSDILEYEKHSRSIGGRRALKGNFGLGPHSKSKNNHSHPDKAESNLASVDVDESADALAAEPERSFSGFARATITKANPRLTAHTVQSLAWGSALGWTTLTANRTSVKAIVKEINARAKVEMFEMYANASKVVDTGTNTSSSSKVRDGDPDERRDPGLDEGSSKGGNGSGSSNNLKAAIWIVDPRSLAEGMRADSVDD